MGFPGEHQLDWAIASIDVLVDAGLERLQATRPGPGGVAGGPPGRRRAHGGAARRLARWCPSRTPTRPRRWPHCFDQGFVLRNLPGTPYVRASVGAWNNEEELERLASGPKT